MDVVPIDQAARLLRDQIGGLQNVKRVEVRRIGDKEQLVVDLNSTRASDIFSVLLQLQVKFKGHDVHLAFPWRR